MSVASWRVEGGGAPSQHHPHRVAGREREEETCCLETNFKDSCCYTGLHISSIFWMLAQFPLSYTEFFFLCLIASQKKLQHFMHHGTAQFFLPQKVGRFFL